MHLAGVHQMSFFSMFFVVGTMITSVILIVALKLAARACIKKQKLASSKKLISQKTIDFDDTWEIAVALDNNNADVDDDNKDESCALLKPNKTPSANQPQTSTTTTNNKNNNKQNDISKEAIQNKVMMGDTTESKTQLKEVIIAFTMHYDIGYTDLAENVLRKYRTTMVDEAIHSVEATSHLPVDKQFVWTTPGWPMQYITKNATPERKEKLESAMKKNRIVLGALSFTSETDSSDFENATRNLNNTSSLCRRLGLPLPRDAKMSDVPEHSWILPTVLTHAGVDALHIGCNDGSASPNVPYIFWWKGPDGSKLFTFYWPKYYGSGLMPPDDWKYDKWLAMISTHENTGPPRPEEVEKILQEAKEKLPGVKVRIGRLSDFYDIMKDEPNIPEVRGDMPDTWIHGYMSLPREVKALKHYQRSIYSSESLFAHQEIWGVKIDSIQQDVETATEKMLLFEEHTFGIAISHGAGKKFTYNDDFFIDRAMGYFDRAELSWREKAAYVVEVEKKGAMIEKALITSLGTSINVNGKKIVVFNALPWERSGYVNMFLNIYRYNNEITGLRDTRDGRVIPVYNNGNNLQFYAANIPSMGYATYIPIFKREIVAKSYNGLAIDEVNHSIENKYVKIEFDEAKGSITSFIDKLSGRELVDKECKYGLGEYFHEYFGKEELARYNEEYVTPDTHSYNDDEVSRPLKDYPFSYEETRPTKGRWVFQKTTEQISATYFGELQLHIPQKYSVTYVIKPQSPCIELVWCVLNKVPESFVEGGWIALPFNLSNPTFHLARLGGIANPAKDLVPSTNHDYIFLNTGLAITDNEGYGAGINSPDAPAVSLERPGLLRFTKPDFIPKKSIAFINLYNNEWGTNFTEWLQGSWFVKIHMWPIQSYTNESGLITPMEETRQPFSAFLVNGPAGKLPTTMQGVRVSRKGIIVSSFTKMSDTGKHRLRLWEMAGLSGKCEVSMPEGSHFTSAVIVNLRDVPLSDKKINITEGKITVEINAYQPITLLLE